MEVQPSGAGFGARVVGVDRTTAPDAETRAAIQAALDEHLVLIFPADGGPIPTNDQLVAFCSAFGPLRPSLADKSRLPDQPGINLVGNREVDGVSASGGTGRLPFHSDLHQEPPLIEFIYLDALEVPSEGGATMWVDLRAAYDALDDADRQRLDALSVRYRLRRDLDHQTYFRASPEALDARKASTEVSLVQPNGRTGRKALWANTGPESNHVPEVVGMDRHEGRALLDDLFAHCIQEQFLFRHPWQPGEACLWHNVQTMHGREAFPDDEVRLMRHVNILGITDPHQRN